MDENWAAGTDKPGFAALEDSYPTWIQVRSSLVRARQLRTQWLQEKRCSFVRHGDLYIRVNHVTIFVMFLFLVKRFRSFIPVLVGLVEHCVCVTYTLLDSRRVCRSSSPPFHLG